MLHQVLKGGNIQEGLTLLEFFIPPSTQPWLHCQPVHEQRVVTASQQQLQVNFVVFTLVY